jgi:hypothetical protein
MNSLSTCCWHLLTGLQPPLLPGGDLIPPPPGRPAAVLPASPPKPPLDGLLMMPPMLPIDQRRAQRGHGKPAGAGCCCCCWSSHCLGSPVEGLLLLLQLLPGLLGPNPAGLLASRCCWWGEVGLPAGLCRSLGAVLGRLLGFWPITCCVTLLLVVQSVVKLVHVFKPCAEACRSGWLLPASPFLCS